MDDLIVTFLRARLDERADQAETLHRRDCVTLDDTFEGTTDPCDCPEPAFVLADVEAKRLIIELHLPAWLASDPDAKLCQVCHDHREPGDGWPCRTLRLLALPDAGHEDYREEWRP